MREGDGATSNGGQRRHRESSLGLQGGAGQGQGAEMGAQVKGKGEGHGPKGQGVCRPGCGTQGPKAPVGKATWMMGPGLEMLQNRGCGRSELAGWVLVTKKENPA